MVVWFYGKEEEKKQKFPEKKIFQFFRSTNNYSKLTSLIVANQNQNHVVKFSKPEITWSLDLFWQNFLSTSFLNTSSSK